MTPQKTQRRGMIALSRTVADWQTSRQSGIRICFARID